MEVQTNQGSAIVKHGVTGRIAYGSGYTADPIVRDGTSHSHGLDMWVDNASPAAFREGSATVQISAYLCAIGTLTRQVVGAGWVRVRSLVGNSLPSVFVKFSALSPLDGLGLHCGRCFLIGFGER